MRWHAQTCADTHAQARTGQLLGQQKVDGALHGVGAVPGHAGGHEAAEAEPGAVGEAHPPGAVPDRIASHQILIASYQYQISHQIVSYHINIISSTSYHHNTYHHHHITSYHI